MASTPNRRDLTDHLKNELSLGEILTGVVNAPESGGWDDDPKQPGSTYVPYCVLLPLVTGDSSGGWGDSGHEWDLPYSLTSYGTDPEQVEDQADTARRIVHEISRSDVDLGGVFWRVMDVRTNSIGGVDINRNIEPPELSQRDVVLIRITKKEQYV